MISIAIVDGKGGGLGRGMAEAIVSLKRDDIEIIALVTNSHATANMLKGGAGSGASGPNAICHMASKVDILAGPMAILVANSMMGEITPLIASEIASSPAQKLLMPVNRCGINVVGTREDGIKNLLNVFKKDILTLIDNM